MTPFPHERVRSEHETKFMEGIRHDINISTERKRSCHQRVWRGGGGGGALEFFPPQKCF